MAIKTTNGFFNWLKSKFYLKTEIDSKLANKASTSVATTSANGLMSSAMVTKLDGIATGANKTTVDSALSSTSTNPVQNRVVKAQVDSLNSAKANTNHTHNDNSGIIEVSCTYGDVWKFKKNGWAVIFWNDINLTNINKGAWTVIASTGWSNQAGATNHYGTFVTGNNNDNNQRFEVTTNGDLRVFRTINSTISIGYYGYIVYPTAD